ncbi:cullin, partial [Helicosporidium sp. ATCC 50920]
MCQHGLGSKLYGQLQEECDRHAQNALAQLASRGSLPALAFLDQCASLWETHCEQLLLTRQIFLYLDRTHVLQASSEARSIFDLGLAYFRTHLARHGAVQEKLLHDLLALIESGRGGAAIDELLARRLVRVFSSLGLYGSVFQPAFLTAATEHYRALGDRLLAQLEVPAYLLAVEQRLHEEGARCDAYLEPATRRPLLAVVEHCLLERHLSQILDLGLD